ncbi:MAG: TraR/DksA C4-type zinc finger protein [Acidimicrobiia bacterium]|nr:TraR/DksA C4-type zinc finger protein [Acidimicrobiia bacterium]
MTQASDPRHDAPSPLSSDELASLRRELEKERDELLEHAHVVDDDENASSATHGQGETEHTANEIERRVNAVLEANADHALHEIVAALARTDDGTYGYCETCAQPIMRERLLAIPAARFCVNCQQNGAARR